MQKKSFGGRRVLIILLLCAVCVLGIGFGPVLFRELEFHFLKRSVTVRPYYFTSLLILLAALLAFFISFEKKKPGVREVVVLSVLTALAVAGRAACFMLPQVAPVGAIVLLTGACLGGQSGFLVGALSAFVSNFFFGQGPWTPWQMFSFGLLGLLAGLIYHTGRLPKRVWSLCLMGFLSTMLVYGGVMNLQSALMVSEVLTKETLFAAYATGVPFDLVHSVSTVLFLSVLTKPMIEKLERMRQKYGLMEGSA